MSQSILKSLCIELLAETEEYTLKTLTRHIQEGIYTIKYIYSAQSTLLNATLLTSRTATNSHPPTTAYSTPAALYQQQRIRLNLQKRHAHISLIAIETMRRRAKSHQRNAAYDDASNRCDV